MMLFLQARVAAAVLIMLQCLLLGNLTGGFLFPMIVAGLSVLSIRISIPISRWIFAVLILMTGLVTVAEAYWTPPEIQNDWILPGRYLSAACKLLLAFQLIELARTKVDQPLPLRFSLIVMASFLLSFCRLETFGNAALFYLVAVASAAAFACLGTVQNGNNEFDPQEDGSSTVRTIVFLIAVAGIALGTSHIANTANSLTASLRYFVRQKVEETIKTDRARVAFTADGRLDSVTQLQQHMPDMVVVTATCDVMPGYLRGRVFNEFKNDRWSTDLGDVRRLVPLDETNREEFLKFESKVQLDPTYRVFKLGVGNEESIRRIQIANSRSLIGKITFSPLSVDYFAYHNRFLKLDKHDVLQGVVSSPRPYQMFVSRENEPSILDLKLREQLLEVPEDMRASLQVMAQEICDGVQTTEEKIARIEYFFRTGFSYSLDSMAETKENRLIDFVLNQRAGHCELFASAAAMVLRLNGVPSRYVTGFAMTQPSALDENDGDMWVARNRDAHAWVEAYDQESSQWVVVESTPGVDVPKSLWLEGEVIQQDIGSVASDEQKRSRWSIFYSDAINMVSRYMSWIFGQVTTTINAALILLFPVLIWYFFRQRRSRDVNKYSLQRLGKTIQHLDGKLRKRNLVRQPSETLHHFAGRLRRVSGEDKAWIRDAAQEYQKYADRCYSQNG